MKRPLFLFVAAVACLLPPLFAQTIPNPSFEADTFTVFPGYVSGNGPITGWEGSPDTNYGLNPAAGSPFANNGVVPDGVNTAFLQRNDAGTFIRTEITGLTDTERYLLTFRTTARGGNAPQMQVLVDNIPLLLSNVRAVGGTNPYTRVAVEFTASDVIADLRIENVTAAGDHTINIDDFAVQPAQGVWTSEAWTDDATSGVDPAFHYTHAFNFGSAALALVNEVPFAGVPGISPAVAESFSTTGLGAAFVNDPNNVVGGSRTLANDFVYNGFPFASVTLEGLEPGADYVFTLYSVGWEVPGARFGTFRSGDDALTVDQNTFDNNNGIRFEYRYTADASGTATVETWPVQEASIHWYGFSNREAAPIEDTAPTILIDPAHASAIGGTIHTFTAAATGTRPIDFQWYKDNMLIPGATGSQLQIEAEDESDAGFYHVEATNAFGTDVSEAGFLQVFVELPGLLFSTGVDETGAPLLSGEDDPHYLLVTNPDGASLVPAVVQANVPGAWLPNSGTSQWVGPSFDTVAAAGGDYLYQTSFDLTGLPGGVVIAGQWAVDNTGTALRVNGIDVPGAALSPGFGGFTDFIADTSLLPPGTLIDGVNSLEFGLNNAGPGFTGLMVDNLRVTAVPLGVAPVIFEHPVGREVITGDTVLLSARAYGTADLSYQWRLDGVPIQDATERDYLIESTTLDDAGDYDVVVTNDEGTATSNVATLTALDVPPTITSQPVDTIAGTGERVEISVEVSGSPTITYQWKKGEDDVPGATGPTLVIDPVARADEGEYSVEVTNPFGSDTSDVVMLSVFDGVPGLYNTGVDATGAPLVDGSSDDHYTLVVNPDGDPLIAPTVQDSTRFPIVAGPWLANSATSKWIGPAFFTETSFGAPNDTGNYHYSLSFDLTGFDLSTVMVMGQWSTDNGGIDILINGAPTGHTSDGFTAFTDFAISSGFVSGFNTLEFILNNSAVGYTGLRVENLRGLGSLMPSALLPDVTIVIAPNGNPVLIIEGRAGTTYTIERSPNLTAGSFVEIGQATAGIDGEAVFEDTTAPPGTAYYHILVPLP